MYLTDILSHYVALMTLSQSSTKEDILFRSLPLIDFINFHIHVYVFQFEAFDICTYGYMKRHRD